MGVFDFLANLKGAKALKNSNLADADLYNKMVNSYDDIEIPGVSFPSKVEPLQIGQDGKIDYNKTLELKQNTTPRTLSEHLLGRNLTMDEQIVNPKTGETELKTYSNFKPGFLNNFDAGLRENYNNDLKIDNLLPGKKDLSYRFGEGIGSIVKGLAGVAGDAYVAGTDGLKPALERQHYRTADRLYRNALQQQGVDTSNIQGLISDDLFKNYSLANYRTRNLDIKQQLGLLKNDTDRAKLVNMMLNSGVLSPAEAVEQMGQYGINISKLDESNQTKLLPYKQYALRNGWDLGWAKFGLTQNTEKIKQEILKDLAGGDNSNNKPAHKTNAF